MLEQDLRRGDAQIEGRTRRLSRSPLLATLLVFLLTGCAGSSVFIPYPGTAQTYRQALDSGKPENAVKAIGTKTKSADGMLYLLERGRIQQLEGHADASKKDFEAALARFQAQDDRATISASALAASGASLYSNDNARPYEGRTYERVFVHQYQALNYLALGDAQGALVEVRRANQVQVEALAKKAGAVDGAREQAERKGMNPTDYDRFFNDMDLAAGRVKSSFQNAATFYLSGLIYEATGQTNDAYIDYRKALEIAPDNTYLQKDVVRTGLRAGMDDAKKLAQQLKLPTTPTTTSQTQAQDPAQGELVIYLEEGLVPAKQPVSIPIYTNRTSNYVSFPIYRAVPAPQPVTLTIDGTAQQSAVLTDTRALAVRTLKDEAWDLVAHSFLRLVAKQDLQRNALRNSQKSDEALVLGIAALLFTVATDQADLRSWLTLPGSAQVLRLPMAEGEHQIALPGRAPVTVQVRANRPTLLHLTVLQGSIYSRIYSL